MLLSEDKFVIDALIKILSEKYKSLEYDEEWSRGNVLKVRKKNPTENLDFSLASDICGILGKVTNRSFFPANSGSVDRDYDKDWSVFHIHESKKR